MKEIKAILKRFFSKDPRDGWPLPLWFRGLLYFVALIHLASYSNYRMSELEGFFIVLFFVLLIPLYIVSLVDRMNEFRTQRDRTRESADTCINIVEELVEEDLLLPRGIEKLRKAGLTYYDETQ